MSLANIHHDVLGAFAILGKTYRTWEIDDATIKTYALLLSDIPPKDFLRACVEHIRVSKFAPTPAEIRELAVRPDQERLTAEEAWSEVMGEIRRVGWIGAPQFSNDEVQHAASALGSWRTLCSQTAEQLAANRAHFMRMYGSFAKSAQRDVACLEADEIVAQLWNGSKSRPDRLAAMYGAKLDELDEPYCARDESIVRAHKPKEEVEDYS